MDGCVPTKVLLWVSLIFEKLHSAHFGAWERRSSNTTCDKTAAVILDRALVAVNCHSMVIELPISPTCSRFSKLHDLRSFNDRNIFTWILRTGRTIFSEHRPWEFFSVWAAGFSILPIYLGSSNPNRVHSPHLYPAAGKEARPQNRKHTTGLTAPDCKIYLLRKLTCTIWILYKEHKPWILALALSYNKCLVFAIPWGCETVRTRSDHGSRKPGNGHPAVNIPVQRCNSLKYPNLFL